MAPIPKPKHAGRVPVAALIGTPASAEWKDRIALAYKNANLAKNVTETRRAGWLIFFDHKIISEACKSAEEAIQVRANIMRGAIPANGGPEHFKGLVEDFRADVLKHGVEYVIGRVEPDTLTALCFALISYNMDIGDKTFGLVSFEVTESGEIANQFQYKMVDLYEAANGYTIFLSARGARGPWRGTERNARASLSLFSVIKMWYATRRRTFLCWREIRRMALQ